MTSLHCSAILVLGLFKVLVLVRSQFYESSCPGVFEYRSDNSGVYGVIHLSSTGPVSSLQLKVNYTVATRLQPNWNTIQSYRWDINRTFAAAYDSHTNYVGRLQPIGNSLQALQDFNSGVPLDYRVDFPVTSPLPRVTAITVNGNILCYAQGDLPSPNQYVTTASLQNTLFFKGQSSPGAGYLNQFNTRPSQSKPKPNSIYELIGSLPDGSQVYSIDGNGADGDRFGSWNSDFKQPAQRPPPPRPPPPPPRPEIQYYPVEPSTQPAPRPPRPPPRVPRPPQQPAPAPSTATQCGVISGGNERVPLIYNGQSYSRGDWPWLVAIYKRKDGGLIFICSGTLVSDRHVVTAAHCMQQKNTYSSKKDIVVKVGVYNLEDWGDDITVTRTLVTATIHESYNASILANDILVLTFDRSVEFNTNIRPACLWSGNPDQSRIVGASGVVAGWGQSESSPAGRGEPRVVRVPVVSTSVCRASNPDFHKLTSSRTLCAGDRQGSGPCLGDSGGGLYLLEGGRWQLRGVVSLSLRADIGDSTCNLNEYIVFTDSAMYSSWIKSVMSRY